MIKAVIFDWGGVMDERITVKLGKIINKRTKIPVERIRLAFDETEDPYALGNISYKEFWKSFARYLNVNMSPEDLHEIVLGCIDIREEMVDFVKNISRNYKTALLSDNWEEVTSVLKVKFSLERLFDTVVFSNEVHLRKPDKRIFDLTAERLKVKNKECVFIDDTECNIEGAINVGMQAVLFKGMQDMKESLRKLGVEFED